MNDFARVESRPKRKALAVWFITYLRERSRKRLINKLQTQTKCRTRWAPRDVRRCAEACHVFNGASCRCSRRGIASTRAAGASSRRSSSMSSRD